ncbi:MAG: hypothetical protein RBS34_06590 [Desulfofustis sp.]|jgi:hypothetical protein|nr:hypothetical protein [Desulfofustis sp.]
MKKAVFILSVVWLTQMTVFSPTAMALTWYKVKVVSTVTRPNGSVIIQFVPGTNETRFQNPGRAQIEPRAEGMNRMLATILTAVALDYEISIGLNKLPSSTPQNMEAVALLSP